MARTMVRYSDVVSEDATLKLMPLERWSLAPASIDPVMMMLA